MAEIKEPEIKEFVTIRMEGDAFGEYYPAQRVTRVLLELEQVVQSTAQTLAYERGVRTQLDVRAAFPRRGSYLQDLALIWKTVNDFGSDASAFVPLAPELIGRLSDLIEWLKKLLPEFEGSKKPKVSINHSKNFMVINNLTVNIDTFNSAADVAQQVVEIAKTLGHGIDQVKLESSDGKTLELADESKHILAKPRSTIAAKLMARAARDIKKGHHPFGLDKAAVAVGHKLAEFDLDESFEAAVDIVFFNKERRTGTLRVISSEVLAEGEYPFELAPRPDTEQTILAMLRSRVRVSCSVARSTIVVETVQAALQ